MNTNGGNLIRTCYSETRRDYLINKSLFIDDLKICLLNETKLFLFHFVHNLITFHFSLAGKKRAYLPLHVCEKTRVSRYKLCDESKSIKLQMLALKKIITFASSTY